MKSLSVIEHLDPFCNPRFSHRSGRERLGVNQLSLEGPEEAFCDCIIPAISPTTHTAGDARSL